MNRLARAIAAIDAANAVQPAALEESRRFSEILDRIAPDASDHLRIAVRGAHLERWTRPRAEAEQGRAGYLLWRAELKKMHAARVGEIMRAEGWGDEDAARVGALIRRDGLKRDPEAQTLEDVVCLDFIAKGFADFAKTQDHDKLMDIVAKTGRKMSARGRAEALALGLPADVSAALESRVTPRG